MKTPPFVVAVSLAANVALLGYIALRPSSKNEYNTRTTAGERGGPGLRASASGGSAVDGDGAARPASSVAPSPDAPPPETWSRLQASELPTFVANLRAAGLPERLVRLLVNAEINERFRAREEAVRPQRPNRNYWEQANNYYDDPTTMEQRLAQIDLRREKAALRRELLGDTPRAADDTNPIPPEKRDLLREINEDYNTMISQIQRETRGISLASDEEKMRFLRTEKEAELRSILTPDELREYEIRSSTSAASLRNELAAFGPTEQEFRSLVALRRQFDEQFSTHPASPTPDYWQQRQAAQKALDAQIAQQLGPERALEYTRAKDHDYRNLTTLTERLGLPKAAANQVYDMRYDVPAAALKIARNENLTPAAKKEGLQIIAQQARDKVIAQLGQEAADAYLRRHGNWIKSLENGQVIEYKREGGQQTHQIAVK